MLLYYGKCKPLEPTPTPLNLIQGHGIWGGHIKYFFKFMYNLVLFLIAFFESILALLSL